MKTTRGKDVEDGKCSIYGALARVGSDRSVLPLSADGFQRQHGHVARLQPHARTHTRHPSTWKMLQESDETLIRRVVCLLDYSTHSGNDWKEDGISTSTSNTFREKLLCRLSCAGFYNSPFSISHVRKKMFLPLETAQRTSFNALFYHIDAN